MGYPDTFCGFCVDSPKTCKQFKKQELKPKPFEDHDVDIQIECCGVCGSDIHTLTGGWGDFDVEGPLCVGHEIVGKAVRVGKAVTRIKGGDRVGVGAQVWACLKCDVCKSKNENYCPHWVDTYNDKYPDGSKAHGGWSNYVRAHQYFVFEIPDALPSHEAAPFLCAGITTYSPLVRAGIGKGKTVAVVGVGGLGHLGIQWSKALGAETYAMTHSPHKVEDAKKLGAGEVIVTTEEGWADKYRYKFDMILSTSDAMHAMDIAEYMRTLKVGGDFHMVGLGDEPLPAITPMQFTVNAPKITGSHIGNHQEMDAMFQLAAEKNVRTVVETIDISEDGCKEALERMLQGKAHFRLTMTGYDKAFNNKI